MNGAPAGAMPLAPRAAEKLSVRPVDRIVEGDLTRPDGHIGLGVRSVILGNVSMSLSSPAVRSDCEATGSRGAGI